MVFDIKYSDDIKKLKEGWYLVKQYIYEEESCGRNVNYYNSNGTFELLTDFIQEKENELNIYKDILNKL